MSSDIVIPKNNEAEFAEIASRLNIKKLYFLYDFDNYNEDEIKKKLNLIENKKINFGIGFIVNQRNINKAFQFSKLLVAKSSDKDRQIIESRKIKIIYGFGEVHKKDYLHQRASGLNHVLCELARKNNVAVGFSYSLLFNQNQVGSLLMGRMMQNIALCQKYKVKMIIGSFSQKPFDLRSSYDAASLFTMLGMDGKNIKGALAFNF